jgi:hypothetical protein
MSPEADIRLTDLAPAELMEMFPEAKLTLRDRIPTNMLYLYTFLNINKTIKDIKFSEAEIREAVLALVAMVPDELRDEQFDEELQDANKIILVDVRPVFCEVSASIEYCQRHGIPTHQEIQQCDYFKMYHAVFNLLERKNMLFKKQPKEIMTGLPADGSEKNVPQENIT